MAQKKSITDDKNLFANGLPSTAMSCFEGTYTLATIIISNGIVIANVVIIDGIDAVGKDPVAYELFFCSGISKF